MILNDIDNLLNEGLGKAIKQGINKLRNKEGKLLPLAAIGLLGYFYMNSFFDPETMKKVGETIPKGPDAVKELAQSEFMAAKIEEAGKLTKDAATSVIQKAKQGYEFMKDVWIKG